MIGAATLHEVPMPGRHVLLVARDQHVRYALADAFLDAGYSLTLAATEATGAMLLQTGAEFDVLVAEPDDHALLRHASRACPSLPVVTLPRSWPGPAEVLGIVLRLASPGQVSHHGNH